MAVGASIVQLDSIHAKQALKLALTRMVWLALALGMLFVLADLLFAFEDLSRVILDGALIVSLITAFALTYRAQRRSKSPRRMVARMLEAGLPRLRNTLINALDFEEELKEGPPPNVSEDLMNREISSAEDNLERLADLRALNPATLTEERYILTALLLLACVLSFVFFSIVLTILPRFFFPFGDFPPYSPTKFAVAPAGADIDYGENLKVTVTATGRIPESVSLVLRRPGGKEIAESPMFDVGDGVFFQTIENVQEDLEYFARIRRGRSKRYKLALIRFPRIEDVIVTYTYPAYTRLRPETRVFAGDELKGYQGTEVVLSMTSNRPLRGGKLTVCGEDYALEKRDRHTVAAAFTIDREGEFSASITDETGKRSKEQISGRITIIPDERPEVAIVSPGMDSFAVPDAKIPIVIEAGDDLGLTRVDIFRNHNDSRDARKSTYQGDGGEKYVSPVETLDLADLGLRPGDVIDYYVTATDNNPKKPQTASSESYRLRIISFEEYREFAQSQMTAADLKAKYDAMLDELAALVEEQEQVQEETLGLEGEAAETGPLSAEARKRLQDAADRQDTLAQRTQELGERLTREADSPPIFDIEKDYKEALREIAERLVEARERMQDAREQMAKAGSPSDGEQPGKASQDAAARLAMASDEQSKALEALGRMKEQFQQGIQQANENLERVANVLADVETFKYLYTLQKSLERQVRSYKDMAQLDLDDQIRLKDLSEQQVDVERALEELKASLRQHADELDELAESRQEPGGEDAAAPPAPGDLLR